MLDRCPFRLLAAAPLSLARPIRERRHNDSWGHSPTLGRANTLGFSITSRRDDFVEAASSEDAGNALVRHLAKMSRHGREEVALSALAGAGGVNPGVLTRHDIQEIFEHYHAFGRSPFFGWMNEKRLSICGIENA
ncbi:hypothetical protein D3C86_1771440 [compost metagenome]